jgi:hypothetical protein
MPSAGAFTSTLDVPRPTADTVTLSDDAGSNDITAVDLSVAVLPTLSAVSGLVDAVIDESITRLLVLLPVVPCCGSSS